LRRGSITRRNSAEERTEPCHTPLCTEKDSILQLHTTRSALIPVLDDPPGLPVDTNREELIKQHRKLDLVKGLLDVI